jgi:ribosomal protein S18 acetylase RimI-like enzyme
LKGESFVVSGLDFDEIVAAAGLLSACGLLSEAGAQEELEAYLLADPELVVVARHGTDVVGVGIGSFDGYRGTLRRVAVAPTHRRKGLGSSIAGNLEERLARRGARALRLHVRADAEGARLFWEARGYTAIPAAYLGKPVPS